MSKAFTREDDRDDEDVPPSRSTLPPGVPNYMTAEGHAALHRQLHRREEERAQSLAAGDTARARRLEARLGDLRQTLASAVIVEPAGGPADEVQFGTLVRFRDQTGTESAYRIVGIDEADVEAGSISWLSPIAKALIRARRGDTISVKLPAGPARLTILDVTWPAKA